MLKNLNIRLIDNVIKQNKINKQLYSSKCHSSSFNNAKKGYDYVIVGGGSAGCVLANRLSENSKYSVCLIEAGDPDHFLKWTVHVPGAVGYNMVNKKTNWHYHTVPQKHLNDRVLYWPRGKGLGGSSSINGMVYVRGHKMDFDRWAIQQKANGWSYDECLPYFRKSTNHNKGGDKYYGSDGPLNVTRNSPANTTLLDQVFIDAAMQSGLPFNENFNGQDQYGAGWYDMTIHNGRRWNTSSAYLRPAMQRKNLTVITNQMAEKILFDSNNKAIGLSVINHDKSLSQIVVNKELILSSGAINSPQLLMLSGVGDKDHLSKLGIKTINNLPGVGSNLQDHLEFYLQYQCKKPVSLYKHDQLIQKGLAALEWLVKGTGIAATSHLSAGAFLSTSSKIAHPDVQIHFLAAAVTDHGRSGPKEHSFQLHIGTLRARSKGTIRLATTNPFDHPLLDANYLDNQPDLDELVECVKIGRHIVAQKAMDPFRGKELTPGINATDKKSLETFVRNHVDSAYHPSCTCAMGTDKDAVVDLDLKVNGCSGLRVVDASVMPSITSGNLNAVVIMIAEKASDKIKQQAN